MNKFYNQAHKPKNNLTDAEVGMMIALWIVTIVSFYAF